MVLLLVVGLAAVILVILIAVFLSVRLGRSDDREEPPDGPSDRDRSRAGADDSRWQDARAPRQPPAGAARPTRGGRPRPEAQDSAYRDPGDRRPGRDQAARPGDYGHPQRRPGRYDTGPVEQPTDPRRPVAAAARRSGSGGHIGSRRAGTGRGRPAAPAAPYDTGASALPAADDFPSGPLHTADFPSDEFPSRPQPAADFPSGGYPTATTAAAEAPTARYRAAGHSGEFPPEPPAADFASGEFAAADFPSGDFPAADFPSGEMPAVRGRGRSAPPKAGKGQDRSDSRRRPAKGQGASKGRSRQQRRRDDDDWPSMDWDKLTDEQYWEQLSADKPLSTTARSPQPAREPDPVPSRNGHSRPAAARPKPPAPASRPEPSADGHPRTRGLPGRDARRSPREAVTQPREATARREPFTPPHEAAARHEAMAQPREPAARREAVTQPREAATERLPARSRQQPLAARPRNGTPLPVQPDAAATPPGGEPSLAMLTSLATGSADAFADPLTSPSFSRRAPDSRSYRGARTSGPANDAGMDPRADHPPVAPSNGHAIVGYGNGGHANGGPDDRTPVNGMYRASDHADQGYAHPPAAPRARPAGTPRPDERHNAPRHAPAQGTPAQGTPAQGTPAPRHAPAQGTPAQGTPAQGTPARSTPPQGNPYGSYVEPAPAAHYPATSGHRATPGYPVTPPLGYQDQPGAGFPSYPGERGYQRPAYDPAASLPHTGPAETGAARLPVHPSGAGQFHPPGAHRRAGYEEDGGYPSGYPEQAPYPDSRAAAGYPPGYSAAAGHAADQYRHDGHGGHPVGQG